jgi:hypothetical protein
MYIKILQWALKYPGILIWFGRKHYKHLMKNNWVLFTQIVPQDIWGYRIYGGRNPTNIVFPNKSEIAIVGFNDAASNLGGQPGAAFFEEVSEIDLEVWNYVEGRLRQPGIPDHSLIAVGVGNPRGHYPLYRKIAKGEGVDDSVRANYVWFKSKEKFANKPNLPHRYYETMLASYPKELQDRFVMGSDDTHAGQIYPEFNREIHVQSFEWQPHWVPYLGVDYGRTDPTAALFFGQDPRTGDVYQIAEHYRSWAQVHDHCQDMDEIANRVGWPKSDDAVGKVIDNNTNDPGEGNKSIRQMFAENGWYLQPSPGKRNSLAPGIERVKNLLIPRAGGMPKFHIHPRCVKTIEEFWMYEWATPATPTETMTFKEKPRDDYNHAMDALRYAVAIMPAVAAPENPRQLGGPYSQLGMDRDEDDEDAVEIPDNVGIICGPENIAAINRARKAGGWRYVIP